MDKITVSIESIAKELSLEEIYLPKAAGDLLGMAMFAASLGLGRSLYAKYGRNILNFMMIGMAGSAACYIVASLIGNAYVGLAACVLTGLCVSMLWPGNIILVGEKFPAAGVAAYALMAAGGDMGCSVAPQLVGVVVDAVSVSELGHKLSNALNMSAEQIGMRAGILVAAAFPVLGLVLTAIMRIYFKKKHM